MRCRLALIMIYIFALTSRCATQSTSKNIRPWAGRLCSSSGEELRETITQYLKDADVDGIDGEIVGLWGPHAGYMFSGQIAANAYKLVQGRGYDVVIIVGPNHYVPLTGGSIGSWDAYQTPLGTVQVDTQLAEKIRSASPLIDNVPSAHRNEHSVEMHIPFIQTMLPGVPIVPMLIANLDYKDCDAIAKAIAKSVKGKRVLIVASADMSHFPNYNDAYDVDLRVLDAVALYDPQKVLKLNKSLVQKNIPGLDCALCGPSALVTVMLASKKLSADHVEALPYANSGDISGERHRVVGYGAAVFYKEITLSSRGEKKMLEEIHFSQDEKKKLFQIARTSIENAFQGLGPASIPVNESNLQKKRGVFVTLTNGGRLRGCIGNFDPSYPLHEIISKMAADAATQDYRFMSNPVTIKEMDEINIKISVLSKMKKIKSIDEIEIGKHGIWIRAGNRSGTYLPEVATELGWNKIQFLEHCCVEKAGLHKDAWKEEADIYIYASQIMDEKDL